LAEELRLEAEERAEVERMEELLRVQDIREAAEKKLDDDVQAQMSAHTRIPQRAHDCCKTPPAALFSGARLTCSPWSFSLP